jgi:hypothetical protein
MMTKAMTHMVPGSLRNDLVADMTNRDCPPMALRDNDPEWAAIKRVRSYGLDTGGMGYVDEPYVGFRLHNLTLEFLCSSVLFFLLRARKYTERRFASGRPYYKHHGSVHCMVFTPAQHRLYLAKLEALLPDAEATSHAFFAGKKNPIQVLRDVQANHLGVDPEELGPVASFGASTADRFTNAKRGES